MNILSTGFIIGFLYSLLAVSTLIITAQEVIKQGFKAGLIASLTNFVIQLLWAAAAVMCLLLYSHISGFTDFHSRPSIWEILPGVVVMLYFAYRIYKAPRPHPDIPQEKLSTKKLIGTIALLSLSKPIRILGYLAFFSMMGIHRSALSTMTSLELILGTGLGCLVFWLLLSTLASVFRKKITDYALWRASKIGAIIILVLALLQLAPYV